MTSHCLNVAGLILNMLGVVLAFFFGFPQPDLNEEVGISVTEATPMPWGGTAGDHARKQSARKAKYRRLAYTALALMFAGFAAQLGALFIP